MDWQTWLQSHPRILECINWLANGTSEADAWATETRAENLLWLAKERGTTYKTAHAALQATRREDRRIARDIPEAAVVRFINWEPTTSAGRSIILALQ
jgi:hypothetical protein